MIEHNLTLAWRQLVKYRLQSAVSIVSLAIGFACFALASMWIKYETTYDAFHKDADRMYVLMRSLSSKLTGYDWQVAYENCDSLVKYCPEVEAYTSFDHMDYQKVLQHDRQLTPNAKVISCDSTFLKMFNVRLVAGTWDFLHRDDQIAVTREMAQRLWGDAEPLGQEVTMPNYHAGGNFTVTAVVEGWESHSCLPFEVLRNNTYLRNAKQTGGVNYPFSYAFSHVWRLSEHADVEAINKRLDSLQISESKGASYAIEVTEKFKLIPLTELRHIQFHLDVKVKVEHIRLFALAGGLLILCGLLNYLTMFINRLFIRQREIALRTVFGATGRNLSVQFPTEYGLVLAIALFFGIYLIKLVLPYFRQLAELPEGVGFVYREGLVYLLVVVTVSLLISLPVIGFFRRQALQNSIQNKVGLFSYNNFRKLSVCLQLGISILFIFCTVVLQKQLYTLRNEDFGFERKNMALITVYGDKGDGVESFGEYLRQQPEVTEVIRRWTALFPIGFGTHYTFTKITQGRQMNVEMIEESIECQAFEDMECRLADFYGLQLLKGRYLQEGDDPSAIVINEAMAKKFNWDDPIGKQIERFHKPFTVVGVVKDFLIFGPTTPTKPTFFSFEDLMEGKRGNTFVFKYQPGDWAAYRKKYEEKISSYGGGLGANIFNVEEEYEDLLESEINLQKLLTTTASVCIHIALFAVWSMIMLTCEQRRKEIAIRKVHGATVKDILDMFFLEYMSLQAVAALVAFPIGYACMKPWLEQYVVQTEISWWIYVGIFLLVALLVALCIGWRVWKTATARPADEICKG